MNEKQPLRGTSFLFAEELKTMSRGEAESKVRALGGYVRSCEVLPNI
jgi:BRCT domain type II-containing protein